MISLAIASAKGGVGKTTLALNLSFALARRGHRVLLVDTDPQGGIGHSLTQAHASRAGLSDIVLSAVAASEAIVHTRLPELDLLPVGTLPAHRTQDFGELVASGEALRSLAAGVASAYDLLIWDTPCGFGGITIGALRAADHVLAPLQAEPIAARTLSQLLDVLATLRSEGERVALLGVVLSMLQLRNKDSLGVAQETWTKLPADLVLETTIARDAVFLEASTAGVPLGLLRRKPPPVASQFDRLAEELEARLPFATTEQNDDGPIALFA